MRTFLGLTIAVLLATPVIAGPSSDILHSLEHFFEDATVIRGPTVVDCTLSRGTQTECFSITVKAEQTTYTQGPWCPTSINDEANRGGIWLKDGTAHDVDGAFIGNLATMYDDDEWQLFNDETGKVRVTDTQTSCEAAAQPDVDPEFNNYCVQCLPEYMPEDATMTYVIPIVTQDT